MVTIPRCRADDLPWILGGQKNQDRKTRKTGMPDEELKAEIERLKAENDQLKQRASRGLSLKVSEKGAVSLYGIGRFPVTLYKEQWLKVLGMKSEIEAFILENESQLKAKE
jgi:hypothetical protein